MKRLRSLLVLSLSALLVLALLPAVVVAAGGAFVDDDNSVFEADIEWLADAGVTLGCNPPTNDRFCPDDNVRRGQMAAFMRRFASFLGGEDGQVAAADHADHATAADHADHATAADHADHATVADTANNANEQFASQYSPYIVPAAAFHGDSQSSDYFYSFSTGRYGAGDGCHYAPAQLPHGATVDNVDFYLYDNDASRNLTLDLVRKELATTTRSESMATAWTSSSSSSIQIVSDDTIDHPVVDHDYAYYVVFCFPASNVQLEVAGVAIFLSTN